MLLFRTVHIILLKLIYYILSLPLRIYRLFLHLIYLFKIIFKSHSLPIHYTYHNKSFLWSLELGHYLIDITGILEIVECLVQIIHPKNRSLLNEEKTIIRKVYGKEITIKHLTIDTYRTFMTSKALAFVGLNTLFINTSLSNELLVHETCHCLQYQRYGSVYILRALLAQNSKEGYEYGGLSFLKKWIHSGNINQFNYEQIAEVFTHYYIFTSNSIDSEYDNYSHYKDVYTIAHTKLLESINNQDSISKFLRLWI